MFVFSREYQQSVNALCVHMCLPVCLVRARGKSGERMGVLPFLQLFGRAPPVPYCDNIIAPQMSSFFLIETHSSVRDTSITSRQ